MASIKHNGLNQSVLRILLAAAAAAPAAATTDSPPPHRFTPQSPPLMN